jgi:hypothetical protein
MDVEKRYLAVISVILAVFLLFSGCTTEEDQGQIDNGEGTDGDATDQNETEFGDCGNDIGNGAEIVSGPSEPEHDADRDNPFRSLTVHPTNSDIVLVGTERNGFVRSVDGGNNWARLRYGLRHSSVGYPEIYDIAFSETNPNTVYAAMVEGAGPIADGYPTSNAGVHKSNDGGETWVRKNCGLDNGCISCIHVSPTDDDIAVIGVRAGTSTFTGYDVSGQHFDGGIFRTTDGGGQWIRVDIVTNDNVNDFMIIRCAKGNSSLLYTFGYKYGDSSKNIGFLKSVDGGASWTPFAPDLREKEVSYFDISSDGETIYAVEEHTIHKSVDGGETWAEHNIQSGGYALAVSPDDSNKVVYSNIGGLYFSSDGLATGNQVIMFTETEKHVSDIVFAPSDSSVVYVITVGYDFYKSIDGGLNFSKIVNLRDDVLNVIL